MFFVSADDNNCGKSAEHKHENRKGRAHGNEFRKKARKKFTGKSADGVEHEKCAVETSFHFVRNVGLGCGNADVIGSYAENSDDEASDGH